MNIPRPVLPAFLIAALVLAACGGDSGQGAEPGLSSTDGAASQMTFRRGNGGDPDSLDPHRSEGTSSGSILRDLFEGLVGETVAAELRPGGARKWEISEDGLSYTFYLHEDARWSNGDAVVAEDYAFGLRRSVSPGTASSYAQLLNPVKNAAAVIAGTLPPEALGVSVIDDHTLRIELESPTPYLLGMLTHTSTFPVHRQSLAAHGDQFTRPGKLVSNGPYMLDEYVAQSHIRIKKNPHYRERDKVAIDTVYYFNTEDRNAELKRYRADELDYTFEIPTTQLKWIREHLGGELRSAPYLSVYYYIFNLEKPPFKDNKALRQALSMAVDRKTLVEKVTGVGEVAAYGFVPPGVYGHEPVEYEWASLSDAQRIQRAQELYEQAGYSRMAPLKTEIRYNTSENHKKIAVAIAAMWKQALGVETTLVNEEWKVFLQTRKKRDAWEVFRFSWVGDYNDANTFLEIMHSRHGQNDAGYSDKPFDELLGQAALETDMPARALLLRQAEQRMLSDYPVMPLYFYVSKHLVKPWVKGYQPNIMNRDQSRYYRVEKD
ncbi:MAG: peptide ABC transporter substrate-binding protein [Gammaproteobacteria bacterium]|nr:peptide ABC transporter substrate-binding protein [Gammaproteobacteria bacterium]